MADVLALSKLFADVTARFEADSTDVPNLFGWRVPSQQLTTGQRIVWVPGDPSGSAGEIAPPRNPGGNPRSLGVLLEIFTVWITGIDGTDPENETAQYIATRSLYDAWYRAVYLAAVGTFSIKSTAWVVNRKERRHGATLCVVATVQAKIPDEAFPVVDVSAAEARITVKELDVTEQWETEPVDPDYDDPDY